MSDTETPQVEGDTPQGGGLNPPNESAPEDEDTEEEEEEE